MSRRANGDGSIWQRKDGRWCAGYYVPTPSGGRVRKYVYGASRDDVRAKLTEIIRSVDQGVPVPVGKLSVADYLSDWLAEVAVHRVRPSTLAAYESNVRLHIVPRIGRRQLGKLNARHVRAMLDGMREDGAKPRLIQYVHATLRTALEHAVREELIPRNVARLVQVTRPERADREALSAEDAKKLLKASRDLRLYALYVVTLLLGLRRSEALAVMWSDIDFDNETLTVRRTLHRTEAGLAFLAPKTRRSRRTVPLPAMVVRALREHRAKQAKERARARRPWPDTDLVFTTSAGTPIEPRNFTRMFGKLAENAGVPVTRLHELRHSCVSLLLDLGVPPRVVMEIVGHSTLEMTMLVYGHVALDSQRAALTSLDELLADDEDGAEDQDDENSGDRDGRA
jgi:integrase